MRMVDRMGRRTPLAGPVLCALCLPVALAGLAAVSPARAYQLEVLDSFCAESGCPDGSQPASLLAVSSDTFLGSTLGGGANGYGAVFQLTLPAGQKSWTESVPYSFCPKAGCRDGHGLSGLVMDGAGNFYGTVAGGGAGCSRDPVEGCGAVIRLSQSGGTWTETVLHAFCAQSACADGAVPVGGVIVGGTNLLYGVTEQGGAFGRGTVFQLAKDSGGAWVESVLHSFCAKAGCPDGSTPSSALVADGGGTLYGTTAGGGANGAGTVYAAGAGGETVLYSFCTQFQCLEGGTPLGGVLRVGSLLYATTSTNGAFGKGTAVALTASGGTYSATILYAFCAAANCADGASPAGPLVMDTAGSLYGTTPAGGANGNYDGAVFKLVPTGKGWTETVLHSFCAARRCTDGELPNGQLLIDSFGNLYGTTTGGGGHGNGVVYELVK